MTHKVKNILIVLVCVLGFSSVVYAAPYFRQEAGLVPITDSEYYLGTTTPALKAWKGLIVDQICLAGDCQIVWPTGGGSGTVSTSTNETSGYVPYWTTTAGTPALLGSDSGMQFNATDDRLTVTYASTTAFSAGGTGSVSIGADFITRTNNSNAFVITSIGDQMELNGVIISEAGQVVTATSFVGALTGNSSTATALAGNGANCVGAYPLGVDASGAVEDCTYAFATTTPWSAGVMALSNTRLGYTVASSSIFGYTPLNPTRQLTISSANGQIVLSAGAQTLEADRTWTLTYTGLATTSQPASSNLLVSNGGAGVYGVGTSTPALSSTFSYSGTLGSFAGGSSGTLSIASNGLTLAMLPTQAANTVLANNTGGTAVPSAVATSTFFGNPTPGYVLSFLSGANTWAPTTTLSTITGTLAIAKGGTGLTSLTGNRLLYSNSDGSALAQTASTTLFGTLGAAGTVLMSSGGNATWTATATCEQITGSAGLCDGDDATGAGGGAFAWTPTTYNGVLVNATSTALWLKATSPYSLIATSTFATYASSTQLTVSGNAWLTGITSAIPLTDSAGLIAEYAGTSCTNQFVRSLSALGAATCATVGTADVSGLDVSDDLNLAATWPVILTGDTLSYGGLATSSAISAASGLLYATGVNTLASVATSSPFNWTGLHTFSNSSSTQLSAGTNTFYVNSSGRVQATDTTLGWSGVVSPTKSFALTVSTTTTWGGTTTPAYIPTITMPFAGTLRSAQCKATTTAAFLTVSPYINTTRPTPNSFRASTTVGTISFTANNTFNSGDVISMYVGTSTISTANVGVTCTFTTTETF